MSRSAESVAPAEGAAAATPRARLVVVDDSAEIRSLLRTTLQRDERFDVVAEGSDGLEAVRLAEELSPDLMVLDISMPALNGIAAASRIRSTRSATCVVMYTAHDNPGLVAQAERAGAAGLVSKALPIERLGDTLASLLADFRENPNPSRPSTSNVEELWQSEERFRLLVEAVEDYAIFMLDPEGIITSWNSGAQRIKGYSASEIIGQHFRKFYPEHRQLEGYPEHELVQALTDGHFEEEGWRVRKDGTLMWANVLITPVYDRDGRHLGFAKVTRDITERRAHQEEREKATQRLADLNAELGRTNKVLAATAEQRAQFLAVSAHELRTPITVISGSASTLSRYWTDLDDASRESLLAAIGSSASRLTRLLNDLLLAARLDAGPVNLSRTPVDLCGLIEESISAARLAIPGLSISAACAVTATVLGDRDRLAQALDNLIHNAAKHGRPPISVELRVNADIAEIRVSDEGGGVPTAARERLFDRFVTGAHGAGTGLGLFIVRELARAHDGDAWYDAAGRDGSPPAFVISLPLKSEGEGGSGDGGS